MDYSRMSADQRKIEELKDLLSGMATLELKLPSEDLTLAIVQVRGLVEQFTGLKDLVGQLQDQLASCSTIAMGKANSLDLMTKGMRSQAQPVTESLRDVLELRLKYESLLTFLDQVLALLKDLQNSVKENFAGPFQYDVQRMGKVIEECERIRKSA